MIPKPTRGKRKAEQHARSLYMRIKVRHRIARLGRLGKAQMSWNAAKRREWLARFGRIPDCSVHGHPCLGVQVGHIWGKDVRPELRFSDRNCSPICARANGEMKNDLKLRREYQETMGLWVERYYQTKEVK